MRVAELKAIARERGLRVYSRLRKAELIAFLQNNPPPQTAPRTRPPRPTRPPPTPPSGTQPPPVSVRFRPDRSRQPELLRKLEGRNPKPPPVAGHPAPTLKPYQLKPKRRKKSFLEPLAPVEPPSQNPPNPKKLKKMKKKLDELNRKIIHSRKKNDGLIHKRNSLTKVIEEMRRGNKKPVIERPFIFTEHEQAFGGAYRS